MEGGISSTDDGFQSIPKKPKKNSSKKHIFWLKSLPEHYDSSTLQQIVHERIGAGTIIHCEPNSARVETIGRDGQSIFLQLHGMTLQGKKIVVQRNHATKSHPQKQSLSGSWTKPDDNEKQPILKPNTQTEENIDPSNNDDFRSLCQQPLSSLLEAYGEQDMDWKNTTVDRLERQGKAPIHVEITSFGYTHGIPKHNHLHSLLVWDCRHLPEVPSHLAWMDGLSGTVRHAMLRNGRNELDRNNNENVRDLAKDVASSVADTVQDSISDGHGYANPLQIRVYVGSENGRHRSVVCAELAATAFRKLLRENKDDRFSVPVSVGTRHLHIDWQQQQHGKTKKSSTKANSQKEKDFEDE
jgi:hypothetical protein